MRLPLSILGEPGKTIKFTRDERFLFRSTPAFETAFGLNGVRDLSEIFGVNEFYRTAAGRESSECAIIMLSDTSLKCPTRRARIVSAVAAFNDIDVDAHSVLMPRARRAQ